MGSSTTNRNDLMQIFNHSTIQLAHYHCGYYPLHKASFSHMTVNRLFFPLRNPGGPSSYIEDEKERMPLEVGKMFFVPAFHRTRWELDEECYFLSIHANLCVFPGVDFFCGCTHILALPAETECRCLMKFFESDKEQSYQNALQAGAQVLSLLARVVGYYAPEEFWKPQTLRGYANLTDYLQKNANAQTTVSELAELRRESRENFTRHFSSQTGMTPKQLIDRFVMQRIIGLMDEGYSFKLIASMLFFRDEFAFSKYFKRNAGISPSKYKLQQISRVL